VGAGKYRHRITIQQLTTSKGSLGGVVKTWSTFATVHAQKVHQASREFFAAQKINAETTDLFVIRYLAGVNAKMQVVYDGRTYDVIGANDSDGRRRELYVMCKEVV